MENVLLDKASKNLHTLNKLKHLAVEVGDYELGAECRKIEKELYPLTETDESEIKHANLLSTLFSMVGVGASPKTSYMIFKAVEIYQKKSDEFGIMDASRIMANAEHIFRDQSQDISR